MIEINFQPQTLGKTGYDFRNMPWSGRQDTDEFNLVELSGQNV